MKNPAFGGRKTLTGSNPSTATYCESSSQSLKPSRLLFRPANGDMRPSQGASSIRCKLYTHLQKFKTPQHSAWPTGLHKWQPQLSSSHPASLASTADLTDSFLHQHQQLSFTDSSSPRKACGMRRACGRSPSTLLTPEGTSCLHMASQSGQPPSLWPGDKRTRAAHRLQDERWKWPDMTGGV